MVLALQSALTDRQLKERKLLLLREKLRRMPLWNPLPGPQTMAYDSKADITGYGGAAGGGKTDLLAGLALTRHKRVLVIRKEKAQTEGVIQRLTEIVGGTPGYNSQKSIWKVPVGSCPLIEFGGLDNPGDERRWQGRPHDLKAYDEVTEQRESQVRFTMGWKRSNDASVRPRIVMTFNPPTSAEGRWVIEFFRPWLDPTHPKPAAPGELRWFTTGDDGKDLEVDGPNPFVMVDGAPCYEFDEDEHKTEDIINPESRTFIPARLTDNPIYMKTGYMKTLQSLPEPLRSQMLYGDFLAGTEDDAMQVIPTAWVELAQARWTRPAKLQAMDTIGVDVARGGKDQTALARRHGAWFDEPLMYPGSETPNGPSVAGLVIQNMRDGAPILIDVIGVGASPYDFLVTARQQVHGINVSEASTGTDQSGRLTFFNLRSELWWKFREWLDPSNNTGAQLPPSRQLLVDLCAPRWSLSGKSIQVESRDGIVKRIGRSPDLASAYILGLIDMPKRSTMERTEPGKRREHNPYGDR